jgi:hypothetical protein
MSKVETPVAHALIMDVTDSPHGNVYRLTGVPNMETNTISYYLQSGSGTPLALSNLFIGNSQLLLPVRPRLGWQQDAAEFIKTVPKVKHWTVL